MTVEDINDIYVKILPKEEYPILVKVIWKGKAKPKVFPIEEQE